jgi:tellurite resistance protein TerC
MEVSPLTWGVTIAGTLELLLFDFVFHVRKAHAPSLREAAVWSDIYAGVALLFGVGVLTFRGAEWGSEYFAGYVTEKALSADNLFPARTSRRCCCSASCSRSLPAPGSSSSEPR